jgi:hypothetical protein
MSIKRNTEVSHIIGRRVVFGFHRACLGFLPVFSSSKSMPFKAFITCPTKRHLLLLLLSILTQSNGFEVSLSKYTRRPLLKEGQQKYGVNISKTQGYGIIYSKPDV